MILPLGKGNWDVICKSIGKKAVSQIGLKPPGGAWYGSVPISLTFASTVRADQDNVPDLCIYTTLACVHLILFWFPAGPYSSNTQYCPSSLTSELQFQIPGTKNSTGSDWVWLVHP